MPLRDFQIPPPDVETLALYHPNFALAVLEGIPIRPNMRTLMAKFSTTAPGGPAIPASFDEQISSYSVFAAMDWTVDPTGAFPGSPLKTLSDTMQALTSGVLVRLVVRGGGGQDYSPVVVPTPLQTIKSILNPTAGAWALDEPDNVQAQFILNAPTADPQGQPFIVWMVFGFWQLTGRASNFFAMEPLKARRAVYAELKRLREGVDVPAVPAPDMG